MSVTKFLYYHCCICIDCSPGLVSELCCICLSDVHVLTGTIFVYFNLVLFAMLLSNQEKVVYSHLVTWRILLQCDLVGRGCACTTANICHIIHWFCCMTVGVEDQS